MDKILLRNNPPCGFGLSPRSRDQPQPGSLFSRSWGRGERDPGNEVGLRIVNNVTIMCTYTYNLPVISYYLGQSVRTTPSSLSRSFNKEKNGVLVLAPANSLLFFQVVISHLRRWQTRTQCCGHIVADTNVSPFARARNICCGHKICVRDTKMFLISFRNILCPQQMFPGLRSIETIMSNNVSATLCPRLPPPFN